ncbi:HEAT repeat domain-containing protein [Magnetococcales bacterium HHB-1]
MALVKKKSTSKPTDTQAEQEQRRALRGPGGLLTQLTDHDPQVRRWAIRDLSSYPEAVPPLCDHLKTESVDAVREAIFTTLVTIGGETVITNLVPLLRSEDPSLRNGSIEVLQELPRDVANHIHTLMDDDDEDVRGFAIDIMAGLKHPEIPNWLVQILEQDQDINVCTKAVECLTEVGTAEHIPALKSVIERFPDEPYVKFSVDMAIRRIQAEQEE